MSEQRKSDLGTAGAHGVDRSGARPDEQETASLPAPDSTAGDPRRSTGGPSLARASGAMAVLALLRAREVRPVADRLLRRPRRPAA